MDTELQRREVYKAIILFGLVSLVGDVIYEGARAVAPSYLGALGATALVVGLVFGVSEFVGLSLRLVSGVLADITGAYWALYLLGYGLIVSIPLLGLTNLWPVAVALIFAERVAKGLRSPARDVLISAVSKGVGAGKAFGLHELMDQVGAIAGPALLGTILLLRPNDYSSAFLSLLIPYLVLLTSILYIYYRFRAVIPSGKRTKFSLSDLPTNFWIYTLAVFLNTAGLIHVSLIVLTSSEAFSPWMAAYLYVLMQAVDAISAPLAGLAYDRMGRKVLYLPFLLSPIPSIATLMGGSNVLLAVIFFGVIYGMQESIYRAAVSDLVSMEVRGTAYGMFNTAYGLGFLVSGSLFGYLLYTGDVLSGTVFSVAAQVAAVTALYRSLLD
ncbi:MAG: MFS transporter [Candidatus Korarchaeota archaeon]|nr:MFS transporter [Candidatus Korarchaeota archaeon]